MKKLLILATTTSSLILSTNSIINSSKNLTYSNLIRNDRGIKQNTNDIKNLKDILINRDLGQIYVGQTIHPTADKLKLQLLKHNFNLDINAISISDITATGAKVMGDNKKYTGKVQIIFKSIEFKKLTQKPIVNLFKKEVILSLAVAKDNHIYVGTNFGNIYKINSKTGESIKFDSLNDLMIFHMIVDNNGNIYVTGDYFPFNKHYNLTVYQSNGKERFVPMKLSLDKKDDILTLKTDCNNNIYVTTKQGKLYRSVDNKEFKLIKQLNEGIFGLVITKENNIYLATNYGKIYKSVNDKSFQLIENLNVLVHSFQIDKNGIIYLIGHNLHKTFSTVIYQSFLNDKFYKNPNLNFNDEIYDLLINKNGDLYVNAKNNIYKTNEQNPFKLIKGIEGKYLCLTSDNQENLYISSNNGHIYKSDIVINNVYPKSYYVANYQYYKKGDAKWNASLNFNKEKVFSIIKYSRYADNWSDFVQTSGYDTLYIKGLDVWAKSNETFGTTSKDYKDLTPFNNDFLIDLKPITFLNDENNPYRVELYNTSSSVFSAYSTDVKCYLDFFIDKETKELKVKFSSSNSLWSAGAYTRNLEVKFKLGAFYFIPFVKQ